MSKRATETAIKASLQSQKAPLIKMPENNLQFEEK
jgi:hypothetical protein